MTTEARARELQEMYPEAWEASQEAERERCTTILQLAAVAKTSPKFFVEDGSSVQAAAKSLARHAANNGVARAFHAETVRLELTKSIALPGETQAMATQRVFAEHSNTRDDIVDRTADAMEDQHHVFIGGSPVTSGVQSPTDPGHVFVASKRAKAPTAIAPDLVDARAAT